jgi:hypothetical protein
MSPAPPRPTPGRPPECDVGCGLGRNLGHLDGNGVGVDHNAESVAIAQSRGLRAFRNEMVRGRARTPGHDRKNADECDDQLEDSHPARAHDASLHPPAPGAWRWLGLGSTGVPGQIHQPARVPARRRRGGRGCRGRRGRRGSGLTPGQGTAAEGGRTTAERGSGHRAGAPAERQLCLDCPSRCADWLDDCLPAGSRRSTPSGPDRVARAHRSPW